MRTGHTVCPNGIISCAMPEEYHGRSSCTLQEVLKSTLCSDNAIDECPEVLAAAFSNMYQEAGDDWWCDIEITDVDAALDSPDCARNARRKLMLLTRPARSSFTGTVVQRGDLGRQGITLPNSWRTVFGMSPTTHASTNASHCGLCRAPCSSCMSSS